MMKKIMQIEERRRWIKASEICIILHIIRKRNSVIVLLLVFSYYFYVLYTCFKQNKIYYARPDRRAVLKMFARLFRIKQVKFSCLQARKTEKHMRQKEFLAKSSQKMPWLVCHCYRKKCTRSFENFFGIVKSTLKWSSWETFGRNCRQVLSNEMP